MPRTQRLIPRRASVWAAASLLAISAAGWAVAPQLDFVAFGNFKRMSHTGNTSGQVKLANLPQTEGHWGLGALAGLKGEIMLHDGQLLLSRGEDSQGRVSAAQPGDEAALFAAARVQQWSELTVPSEMSQLQFEAFVLEKATAMGLDGTTPFPFLVRARYPRLTWHVVTGEASGGAGVSGHSGHENIPAGMRVFDQPGATGELVGIYSGPQLEGVVTLPGSRFHAHFVDRALSVSGHVDAYSVEAGSLLKLPVQ